MRTQPVRAFLFAALFILVGCAAKPQPFMVPLSGGIVREGSLEQCISTQLQQGLSVTQAGDACLPVVTVAEFNQIDLEALRTWAVDKLGGPIFVIPLGPPHDDSQPTPKPPPF
jgi:hypothetical protein